MMNKKAGERILSIYLFIIYIIVGVGIVSGVILFRSSSLDVREIEAEISYKNDSSTNNYINEIPISEYPILYGYWV